MCRLTLLQFKNKTSPCAERRKPSATRRCSNFKPADLWMPSFIHSKVCLFFLFWKSSAPTTNLGKHFNAGLNICPDGYPCLFSFFIFFRIYNWIPVICHWAVISTFYRTFFPPSGAGLLVGCHEGINSKKKKMSLSYPEAWIFSPRFLSFYPNYNKSDITEVYLRTRSQVHINTDERVCAHVVDVCRSASAFKRPAVMREGGHCALIPQSVPTDM